MLLYHLRVLSYIRLSPICPRIVLPHHTMCTFYLYTRSFTASCCFFSSGSQALPARSRREQSIQHCAYNSTDRIMQYQYRVGIFAVFHIIAEQSPSLFSLSHLDLFLLIGRTAVFNPLLQNTESITKRCWHCWKALTPNPTSHFLPPPLWRGLLLTKSTQPPDSDGCVLFY